MRNMDACGHATCLDRPGFLQLKTLAGIAKIELAFIAKTQPAAQTLQKLIPTDIKLIGIEISPISTPQRFVKTCYKYDIDGRSYPESLQKFSTYPEGLVISYPAEALRCILEMWTTNVLGMPEPEELVLSKKQIAFLKSLLSFDSDNTSSLIELTNSFSVGLAIRNPRLWEKVFYEEVLFEGTRQGNTRDGAFTPLSARAAKPDLRSNFIFTILPPTVQPRSRFLFNDDGSHVGNGGGIGGGSGGTRNGNSYGVVPPVAPPGGNGYRGRTTPTRRDNYNNNRRSPRPYTSPGGSSVVGSPSVQRQAAQQGLTVEQLARKQNVMLACPGTQQGESGWYEYNGVRSRWNVSVSDGSWTKIQ
jgi:hypothetical protein